MGLTSESVDVYGTLYRAKCANIDPFVTFVKIYTSCCKQRRFFEVSFRVAKKKEKTMPTAEFLFVP